MDISETCDYDPKEVKPNDGSARNSVAIEAKLVALAAWMKRTLWRNNDPGIKDGSADQAERETKRSEKYVAFAA